MFEIEKWDSASVTSPDIASAIAQKMPVLNAAEVTALKKIRLKSKKKRKHIDSQNGSKHMTHEAEGVFDIKTKKRTKNSSSVHSIKSVDTADETYHKTEPSKAKKRKKTNSGKSTTVPDTGMRTEKEGNQNVTRKKSKNKYSKVKNEGNKTVGAELRAEFCDEVSNSRKRKSLSAEDEGSSKKQKLAVTSGNRSIIRDSCSTKSHENEKKRTKLSAVQRDTDNDHRSIEHNNTGNKKKKHKHSETSEKVTRKDGGSSLLLDTAKKSSPSQSQSLSDKKLRKTAPFDAARLRSVLSNTPEVRHETEAVKKKERKSVTLAEKMKHKLNAARFRYLNEQLYKQTGKQALGLFKKDPQAFRVYHEGFEAQVSKWPTNPVNRVIQYIRSRPSSLVVADLGCGDAKVAQSVPNTVHSFDLVAINDYVTACDIAKVPLPPGSTDICVFCLSLMGTNLVDYLCQANKILKKGGVMLVAEVVSRFEQVKKFVKKVEKLGFSIINQDESGKMFVWFEFKKTGNPPTDREQLPSIALAPCTYKKR